MEREAYPSDLSDEQWVLIEPMITAQIQPACAFQQADSTFAQVIDLMPSLTGRGGLHALAGWRAALLVAVRGDFLADGFSEVVPEVPPVADLYRLGQRPADRLGVGGRAVAAHGLDARTLTQPPLQRLDGAAGQHVDTFTGLDVDQDGGVVVAAAQGEVVDPQNPGHRPLGYRQLHQRAQGGVPGDGHSQYGQCPATGPAR